MPGKQRCQNDWLSGIDDPQKIYCVLCAATDQFRSTSSFIPLLISDCQFDLTTQVRCIVSNLGKLYAVQRVASYTARRATIGSYGAHFLLAHRRGPSFGVWCAPNVMIR